MIASRASLIFGISGILLLLATTASAPVAALAGDTDVIARVGATDVTIADVRSYLDALDANQRAQLKQDPELLSQAVRTILMRRVVLKEALAKKWDQQPVVVSQLARARDNIVTETYIESVSKPPEGYPSDAEAQAAYEANKTAFLAPRQFLLTQIFVAAPKDPDKPEPDAPRKRAEDLARKAKHGGDFDALRDAESDDRDPAKKKTDLGWLYESQLAPELRTQVTGMQKGDITDPLRLNDGWHILKLLDTQPAHTLAFSDVRDQIAQRMRAEKTEANRRAFVAKLMHDNPPVINELALTGAFGRPDK